MRLFARTLFFLATVLLTACAKRQTPPPLEEDMLYRVECFFQSQPDSAMQILDTLNLSVLSEKERAHYCLLRARVNDFFRKRDSETDSLLHVAEDYFAGSKDKYFEAMTYFTLARQYGFKSESKQTVLDYRLKALQSIEQCRHVDERLVRFSLKPTDEQNEIDRVKYAIHQRLGMSYAGTGYHREGVDHLKLADDYYAETQNLRGRIITVFPLGMSYLALGEYDSCLICYQNGLHCAEMLGDSIETAYFHKALSEYYLYRQETQHFDNKEDSINMLHQAVAECRQGLDELRHAEGMMAQSYRYELISNLSRAYFDLQQYDSCIRYGRMAVEMVSGDENHVFHYKHLYRSYKALDDAENAALYADKLLEIDQDHGEERRAVAEVKDEYDKQLELQRVEHEHQTKRLKLIFLIAVLALALLATWLFINRYRKNKELETLRLREEHLQLQSEKERMTHEASENLLRRAMKIFADRPDDACQRILAEFNATYPKSFERLKKAYPDLTEQELGLCVLGHFPFRAKEIAQLMNMQEGTVYRYRTLIRRKTGTDDLKTLVSRFLD